MTALPSAGSGAPLKLAAVDHGAIARNVAALAALAGSRPLIAMVGADALGHGLVPVARTVLAAGAAMLAVPDLGEARLLRDAGVTAPVITWLHLPGDLAVAASLDVTPAISSVAQYDEAAAAGVAAVHLVPAVGGVQPGIPAGEWPLLCDRAAAASAPLVTGLMSTATGPEQRELFVESTLRALEAGLPIDHLHSIDFEPGDGFDGDTAVRVGAPLFGLSDRGAEAPGLEPAMTLAAGVVGLKGSAADVGVSYGYRYRTSANTTLAMVAIGYADGVDRAAGNLAPVVLAGRRFTVAGRVAMDALVLDIGDLVVEPGEPATLFGDPRAGAPAVSEWASALGTTSAEIVARIAARIPRSHA